MRIVSKNVRVIIVGGFCVVTVWFFVLAGEPASSHLLYLLDVGQGDASLLRLDGQTILVDVGKDVSVVRELDKIGIPGRNIDMVFLSHPQVDHAGGMIDVVRHYKIGVVVYNGHHTTLWQNISAVLEEEDIPFLALFDGDKIRMENWSVEVIWPSDEIYEEDNDRSLVLKFEGPDFSALFTGDISSDVEKRLVQSDIDVDVLKVPHHGSKYSSSKQFLEWVSPLVSLIGVGKNSYGHPTKEVLGRLGEVGSLIFRSDMYGSVYVAREDEVLKVYPAY